MIGFVSRNLLAVSGFSPDGKPEFTLLAYLQHLLMSWRVNEVCVPVCACVCLKPLYAADTADFWDTNLHLAVDHLCSHKLINMEQTKFYCLELLLNL